MDQVDEYIDLLDRANSDLSDIEEVPEEINDQETQNENTEPQDSTSTDVKPPPRKRNINRVTLNAARLKGPRGLICIESMFSKLKFKGRGYEQHDLEQVMSNLQYWCHRLYPKFTFDDCLGQLEKLGTQRPVMTLKKKILYNMIDDIIAEQNETELIDDVNENRDENNTEEIAESQMEDISEFDKLRDPISINIPNPPQPQATTTIQLTDEQKEMIERNRQIAAERLRARLEAKRRKLEESNASQDLGTSNSQSSLTEEQRSMIEKNRLLALERRRKLQQNKSATTSTDSQSLETVSNSQISNSLNTEIISQSFETAATVSQNVEPDATENNSTNISQSLEINATENYTEICISSPSQNNTAAIASNSQTTTENNTTSISQSLETTKNENEMETCVPSLNGTTEKSNSQSATVSQNATIENISQSLETAATENEMETCISSPNNTAKIDSNCQFATVSQSFEAVENKTRQNVSQSLETEINETAMEVNVPENENL